MTIQRHTCTNGLFFTCQNSGIKLCMGGNVVPVLNVPKHVMCIVRLLQDMVVFAQVMCQMGGCNVSRSVRVTFAETRRQHSSFEDGCNELRDNWPLLCFAVQHAEDTQSSGQPSQIYNVDESGIPLNSRPPKLVTINGRVTKKVSSLTFGYKRQIITVGCANANGQDIPPVVIYDAERLNSAWMKDEVSGTKYGISSNGWINFNLLKAWFVEYSWKMLHYCSIYCLYLLRCHLFKAYGENSLPCE